jgi:glyoxylase-like metal-dependent hydrolase (beta-lactamase superfamily II)/rhodanese-related sulfurtransferase
MENTSTPNLFFQQYYLQCLSHASYLVGDKASGLAVVVDPQRDIAQYLNDARANNLKIVKIIETHFHADFLSGHLELAAATGATIVYGAAAEGRVDFAIETYRNGEKINLGAVELEILETPGHTPESISVVIRNGRDAEPTAVLTGDTLFIGDVGRPDLLATVGVSADSLARDLYNSLHNKLLKLPDATKVYPAHGAGSSCGRNLSTETVSTIGEQRRDNYALAPMSVEQFIEAVTQGQSVAPLYFLFAATKNRAVRELFDESEAVTWLTIEQLLKAKAEGAVLIDSRDDLSFAAGHIRGSINVGLGGRFAEYVGAVVKPDTPIVMISDAGVEAEAKTRLARIGFDNYVGTLTEPIRVMSQHPELVEQQSRLSAAAMAERVVSVKDLVIVDVRNPGEVESGAIAGAKLISLPALIKNLDGLDKNAPTIVYCAGGYRSSIASSLLKSHGFKDVSDLLGGFQAWQLAAELS